MEESYPNRKHCGKRRNCSLRAISPFPTVFSKGLFPRDVKGCHSVGMGYCIILTVHNNIDMEKEGGVGLQMARNYVSWNPLPAIDLLLPVLALLIIFPCLFQHHIVVAIAPIHILFNSLPNGKFLD